MNVIIACHVILTLLVITPSDLINANVQLDMQEMVSIVKVFIFLL